MLYTAPGAGRYSQGISSNPEVLGLVVFEDRRKNPSTPDFPSAETSSTDGALAVRGRLRS